MKFFSAILILLILNINLSFAKDILLDKPIDLTVTAKCDLNEFCKKFIDNIDIETFIKEQIKGDFIPVSLDECISVAMRNNFDIQIKYHEFKSAKYNYEYSLSKFLPNFETTSYIAHYAGQILVGGVLSDNFDETAVSINLNVYHSLTKGGKEIFEAKAAKYFSKSKNHTQNFTKSQVIYLTSKYYYEALLAKIYTEIYLRNLIERNAQLTLAKSQEKAGFGTHFDVIRSQNESLDAKNKVLNALYDFRISETNLANILGIEVETKLMPFEDEVSELDLIDYQKPIEELYLFAIDNREDLKSDKALINYERQVKNTIVTDFIPKPYIGYQQQFQGTAKTSFYPNYIVAGYLSWQPGEYFGVGTMKKIKVQNEKIKTKKLEYENNLRMIKENLIKAQSSSFFNKKQIEINKERLDFSKESIKLATLRFNNGKGILLDVIQAQNEVTTARVQYVASIINYNISQLDLVFNCGTISKEKILENYKP